RLEQLDQDAEAMYEVDEAEYAGAHSSPLSLLGRSESRLPASPQEAVLETFQNPSPHRDYLIQFQTEEFTSMCPVTGQPDFAKISIEYVPDILCVESKSLKFYLASFRNERAFNEAVTNRILDDFVNAVQPRKATVKGAFAARGGISLSVTADYVQPLEEEYLDEQSDAAQACQQQPHGQSTQPQPAPLPKGPGAAAPAEVPSRRPLLRRPLGQMARGDNGGRPETETKVL
ncbi:MAG TPA: preQ(1) synthase, partial [Candidatus Methylacidiphilales bacterium]|nr:preQ(1) synthase [Candidatus Methylacidiphilales bacterium]